MMHARLRIRKLLVRRVLLRFVCALLLFIIVIQLFSLNDKNKDYLSEIRCYESLSDVDSLEPLDQTSLVERSIFFHETSCFGGSETILNARKACAVESAAMTNPNMTVYLLYLSPSKLSESSRALYEILKEYPNVKVRRILITEYVRNTPLEDWYASGVWKSSHWPRTHMSEFLRYLTLWKYGGIYVDLDVVVKKSLQNLTNFVGAQDSMNINSAIMGFTKTGFGRKIVTDCLLNLMSNFRGDIWTNNGFDVITRILKQICKSEHITDMTPDRCNGFHVYPPSIFYPISYGEWAKYFESTNLESTMKQLDEAKIIHVWNKFSQHRSIRVGEKVPYAIIAEKYCPRVYKSSGETF